MQADNESFEKALAPQPTKRKRSSILKQADKRASRDSRTVSFNDKYYYKELYKDGTCDITNFFLSEDMDITMIDIVDPNVDLQNQTIDNSVDMSMDRTITGSQFVDISVSIPDRTTICQERTLEEDDMLEETRRSELDQEQYQQQQQQSLLQQQHHQHQQLQQQQQHQHHQQKQQQLLQQQRLEQLQNDQHLDPREQQQQERQQLQHQEQQQTLDRRQQQQQQQQEHEHQQQQQRQDQHHHKQQQQLQDEQQQEEPDSPEEEDRTLVSMTRFSDISSLNVSNLTNQFANDTLFGAFHDSNNMSILSNRTSGVDTLMHNIEALNDCIQKVDNETEACRRKLDAEIEELFKFYRHIVNKNDKYEFAISIFGLRHSLWLIIKINPETYPNEKLRLKFAFNRKDRDLYPFKEFAQTVERCTKEGTHGYLTKLVIHAQRFRRFLRKVGYRKITN